MLLLALNTYNHTISATSSIELYLQLKRVVENRELVDLT